MKFYNIFLILIQFLSFSCSASLYDLNDTSKSLRAFLLTKENPSPGKVCGRFIRKSSGCIILSKGVSNKAESIQYRGKNGKDILIEEFSPPLDFVYLEKYDDKHFKFVAQLDKEKREALELVKDAVVLNYFEKSAVIYYWEKNKFQKVWIND